MNKFKSIEELERAYLELEKEFTKKCQKLKEYEKEKPKGGKRIMYQYFISFNLLRKSKIVASCDGIIEANQKILTSEDIEKLKEQLADENRDNSPKFDFVHILSLNYLGKEE